MRFLPSIGVLALLIATSWHAPVQAQPPAEGELSEPGELDASADESLDEDTGSLETPELRAPELTMPDIGDLPDIELPPEEEDEPVVAIPVNDSADPTANPWRRPEQTFTFEGYMRLRAVLWNGFGLGRDRDEDPGAFRYFRTPDRNMVPAGGCGDNANPNADPSPTGPDSCGDEDHHRFASMRLRLRPTLSLSDEVRVHATFDVFDNMVLGSTPAGNVYLPPSTASEQFTRSSRVPGVYSEIYNDTQNPQSSLRNSLRDSIVVRRAWAEVSNRGIGQLRIGRMGSHWGLGMVHNAGNDIDGDFSTDVDRIMFATQFFGLSGFVSYDFADQGVQRTLAEDATRNSLRGVPYDATDSDDMRQISAALAWRTEEGEAQERLRRGETVFDIGAHITARRQSYFGRLSNAFAPTADFENVEDRSDPNNTITTYAFARRDMRVYTPDLWMRLRTGGLRIELEAALTVGEIGNFENVFSDEQPFEEDPYRLLQFALALEADYRVPELDNKLYIRFAGGFATGDRDIDGLSWNDQNTLDQRGDRTLSQFAFHPNYRIDLILWRHIMGRVAGAMYLKPGLGYDIIRSPRGRLFGLSADVIYSRAAFEAQTYGSDPNLGLELNLAAYYRSEDGPGFLDGFYASFQYGVLFPFQGLGYLTENGIPEVPTGSPAQNPDLTNAQHLRVILGVQY
ncbi:MAG: TIGR04551 family protein [Polyangiales bacterium]